MSLRVEAVEIAGGLGGPGPGPAARLAGICRLGPALEVTALVLNITLLYHGYSEFCKVKIIIVTSNTRAS